MSLTLVLEYESSALAAPQSFRDKVQAAANILDSLIQDNITVTIQVGYGDWDNNIYTGLTTGALGGNLNGLYVSYTNLRTALASHETSNVDQTFVNSLPNTTSINGHSTFYIPSAAAKALGLLSPVASGIDGAVGFGTGISGSLLVGVALHELTHAMGREGGVGPFDLFRYTSPGNHLFSGSSTAPAAYFSIDGGTTKLADFGQTSDPSDFLNAGVQGANDTFNEFYGNSTLQSLTNVDKELLDALGFSLAPTVGVGSHGTQLLSGYFDGSGKADLAVAGLGAGGIDTYSSNGDGTFDFFFSSQTGSDWASWPNAKAITGNFNGDGKTDIAVTSSGLGGIGSYLSNGDRTFHAVFSSQAGSDWASWPSAKTITGDFNGDGKTDIAVTSSGLGGVGSYLSNGDGTFHAIFSSQAGSDWASWPNAMVITGDFNGDGKADIAVTSSGLGGVGSYLSNGDGTFHAIFSSQAGRDWASWPNAKVIAGDFSGDGKTDIAVVSPGLGGIGSYLSNGDGTFHAIFSSQAGSDWASWPDAKVITGDFNGDGKTDIAVTSPELPGIATYLSNGDGTFHAVFSSQVVSNSAATSYLASPDGVGSPAGANAINLSGVIVGGGVNQTLTGTGSNDTFVFAPEVGNATVTNFQPETDVIQIDHSMFASVQAVITAAQDDGHGDVVITADAHNSITLQNVALTQLFAHQSDFHLV